jgi:hypothetical protein
MDKPTAPKNVLSAQEVLRTEIIVNQALIDILIAKQVISEEELVNSIRNIKRDQQKLLNESSKIISFKR